MSYDIDVYCQHCQATVVGWNYTSNCSPMWRDAGIDFNDFANKPCSEMIEPLTKAIERLEADPVKYKAMNPANGWGSYESLVPALKKLLSNITKHPSLTIAIWS